MDIVRNMKQGILAKCDLCEGLSWIPEDKADKTKTNPLRYVECPCCGQVGFLSDYLVTTSDVTDVVDMECDGKAAEPDGYNYPLIVERSKDPKWVDKVAEIARDYQRDPLGTENWWNAVWAAIELVMDMKWDDNGHCISA